MSFIYYLHIFTGLSVLLFSQRFEYGIFNYSVSLNYGLLSLIGIEYIKVGILNLIDFCLDKIPWFCMNNDNLHMMTLACIIQVMLIYDSCSVFVTYNHTLLFSLFEKIILITGIYSIVMCYYLDYLHILLLSLVCFNLITIIIERWAHKDEFRYGVIHYRYTYVNTLIYLSYVLLIIVDYLIHDLYDFHHILLVLSFNYHFQLNMFYKLLRWEYNTFFRPGIFSHIFLIIDYYDFPDPKT